jgi:hypothetical protein
VLDDGLYGEANLSRRERRERERQSDPVLADAEAGDREPTPASTTFAEPLLRLEAPERDQISLEEPSPAVRLGASAMADDAPTSAPFDLDTRFDDLLGEAAMPRSAYAHVGESATSYIPTATKESRDPEPARSNEGAQRQRVLSDVSTSTGPIWVIAMVPVWVLLSGLLLLLAGSGTPTTVMLSVIFGVPYVAGIVLAILDYVQLRRAGLKKPALWIWAFLTPITYLIVRLVRTARETGTGFGPILTYSALFITLAVATAVVPGLIIEIDPGTFSHQAEVSIEESASALGTTLTASCPATPPLIPQQSFVCEAHKPGGSVYDVTVSLQRSNGWIDWRVDDWGVFSAN